MEYINIDIGHVTVSLGEMSKDRLLVYLGELASAKKFYGGWINSNNPSPSTIGFAVIFDDEEVYANFHDLPFYYRNNWDKYHRRIVAYVTKHPLFEGWQGHGHRFSPERLPILVSLLNQLVEEDWDFEEAPPQSGNLSSEWSKTRQLGPAQTIHIQRNENEEYEDYVFRVVSDVPDGNNEFGLGGQNFLASWLIENREKRDDELPNAAAMGLKFNNVESGIVSHILDGKLIVNEISLGSGRELQDGIIEDKNERRDK